MSGSDGIIIFFLGSKGGCGCSFIANTVASYLAMKKSKNIILIDLNTARNDSRIIFNLLDDNNHDIGDLEDNLDDIDASILKKIVISFNNSLNLILPPLIIEDLKIFDDSNLIDFFELLKRFFDIIIVDFPYQLYLNNNSFSLENIDRFVLISQADIVSVSDLSLLIENLKLDSNSSYFDILINKFNLRFSISPARITNIIKFPVNTFVPYDRDIEYLYLNRGPFTIFKYNLRIIRSISDFADNIYGYIE